METGTTLSGFREVRVALQSSNNRLKGRLVGRGYPGQQSRRGDPNLGVGLPIAEVTTNTAFSTGCLFALNRVGLKLMGNEGFSDLDANTRYEQTEFNAGVGFLWGQFMMDTADLLSLNRVPTLSVGVLRLFAGCLSPIVLMGAVPHPQAMLGRLSSRTASAPEGL